MGEIGYSFNDMVKKIGLIEEIDEVEGVRAEAETRSQVTGEKEAGACERTDSD